MSTSFFPRVGSPFSIIFTQLLLLISSICSECDAANLGGKTVEVFNTGGIGLRAWENTCSGSYLVKSEGVQGKVIEGPILCDGYNRWKVKWNDDTSERWSAEDFLRVIPPNLRVTSVVNVSPNSIPSGGSITVSCDIRNIGLGIARASGTQVRLMLPPSQIISSADPIGTPEIDPGSVYTFSSIFRFSDNVPPGTYYIIVEVDSFKDTGQIKTDDDIGRSPDFTIALTTYTVTPSAGLNGSLDRSDSFPVISGEAFQLLATPNTEFVVDQWFINDLAVQNGGNTLFVGKITMDLKVSVTFKPRGHSIHLSYLNGIIVLDPQLSEYPHGSSVTAQARPSEGYLFSQWSGSDTGFMPTFTFSITKDWDLTALFIQLGSPTISMAVANSTPSGGVTDIPTAPGYVYVLFESRDLGRSWWRPVTAKNGAQGEHLIGEFLDHTPDAVHIFTTRRYLSYFVEPFLRFPIKDKLLNDGVVTSVLDHHGLLGLGQADGAILTCRSGLVTIAGGGARGYRNVNDRNPVLENVDADSFRSFDVVSYPLVAEEVNNLPFAYADPNNLLFYDGHAGYDYGGIKDGSTVIPVSTNTEIVAAAEGDVVVNECGGPNNQIVISHKNGSYKTYYLHLDRWDGSVMQSYGHAKTAHLYPGNTVGWAGSKGAGVGVHLHFQVEKFEIGGSYSTVDPYGFKAKDGSIIDPWLWLEPDSKP